MHAGAEGCRIVPGMRASDLPQVFRNRGAIDQESCTLLEVLQDLVQSSDPLVQQNSEHRLADVFLVLQDLARQDGKEVTLGYLVKALGSARIDARRREQGRPRCGRCTSYGWVSRRCLHREAVHLETLLPDSEPHRLQPACRNFRVQPVPVGAREQEPDSADQVLRALDVLEKAHPGEAALLVEHHLEGRSLRSLAQELGCDRRRLAEKLKEAESLLGYLLEDLG
jgi:DNA-directed RNA polymerase specialized sigma24 family protein